MDKLLKLLPLFFVVSLTVYSPLILSADSIDLSEPIGADAQDYIDFDGGFQMVYGHFLTLAISTGLATLLPQIQGIAMLLFFATVLVSAFYYFLKNFTDNAWLVFLLLPFSMLVNNNLLGGALYGQLFALSIWLFAAGLFLNDRKMLASVLCLVSVAAHFWTGAILSTVFLIYLVSVEENREDVKPIITLTGGLFVSGLLGIPFVDSALSINQGGGLLHNFLILGEINLGILAFAGFGVWKKDFTETDTKLFILWTGLVGLLMIVLAGSQLWRLWSLLPFFPLAVMGADWCWGKDRALFVLLFAFTVISVGVWI